MDLWVFFAMRAREVGLFGYFWRGVVRCARLDGFWKGYRRYGGLVCLGGRGLDEVGSCGGRGR